MNPVVACSLNTREQSVRGDRWRQLGARAGVVVTATDRGLQLAFGAGAGVEAELHELAALERECCAFADWEVRPEPDRVLLEVSGKSPEAVVAVQAMFGALRSAAGAA
jgi:hypothetical protein